MFYYISGTLAHKEDGFAVIDAGGVGYKLLTSLGSLDRLGAVGSDAKMYTHLYVREGVFDLYGFASQEELGMFLLLTGVSGVGPKAALAVLGVLSPAALSLAVVSGDTKSITRANGVGPKVAQRIVMELKDKIKNEDMKHALNADEEETKEYIERVAREDLDYAKPGERVFVNIAGD